MKGKKARPAPPKAATPEEANGIIQALWDRLNDIEDRLKKNSRNSSRPPTSDGFSTPDPTRKPSGKARGAQPGHKGSKRLLVDEVDNTQQHFPAAHCQCGGQVTPSSTPYRRHQIFDIPAQAYSVDEHQLYRGTCEECGDKHQAGLPQTLTSGQMGPNVLAFVAVQAGQFHQSISEIQQQQQLQSHPC
ncbi:MAG: transposase [Paraglaciecola sp.]|jgi:transposase